MNFQVVFTEEAKEDVDMIASHYANEFDTGAGDFLDAVVDTLDKVVFDPKNGISFLPSSSAYPDPSPKMRM